MTAVTPRYTDKPITYTVQAVVAGGQLVDADQNVVTDPPSVTGPSAANSKLCLGVALEDAAPPGTDSSTDAAARPPLTPVARNVVVPVTFTAASKIGDRLKCAANGAVTVWVDGTDDPALIVGQTRDASVSANTVGLALIFGSH